jgi:hypothetical protein
MRQGFLFGAKVGAKTNPHCTYGSARLETIVNDLNHRISAKRLLKISAGSAEFWRFGLRMWEAS